mmetsp:Transcript_57579/g.135162  ORF Transcript_57579/g.135162 Transcript_57579/m.135162 type:complete len:262 (-) Transcript_57579:16-801(-)
MIERLHRAHAWLNAARRLGWAAAGEVVVGFGEPGYAAEVALLAAVLWLPVQHEARRRAQAPASHTASVGDVDASVLVGDVEGDADVGAQQLHGLGHSSRVDVSAQARVLGRGGERLLEVSRAADREALREAQLLLREVGALRCAENGLAREGVLPEGDDLELRERERHPDREPVQPVAPQLEDAQRVELVEGCHLDLDQAVLLQQQLRQLPEPHKHLALHDLDRVLVQPQLPELRHPFQAPLRQRREPVAGQLQRLQLRQR